MGTINVNANIEVDIEDLFTDRFDRKQIFEYLIEEGYVPNGLAITNDGYLDYLAGSSDVMIIALSHLTRNSWKLTNEESEVILKIADKYKYL